MRSLVPVLFILVIATSVFAAEPSRDELYLPEAWAGVWDLEMDSYDCLVNQFLGHLSDSHTFCTGDMLNSTSGECEGTVTDSEIHFTCIDTFEFSPGCFRVIILRDDWVREGDSMSGVIEVRWLLSEDSGDDCPPVEFCNREEWTGTRVAPEPDDCEDVVATDVMSWGTLKSLYR